MLRRSFLFLSALLSGCGIEADQAKIASPEPGKSATDVMKVDHDLTHNVASRQWALVRLEGEAVPQQNPPAVVLIFAKDGFIGGKRSCNNLGSRAQWHMNGTFSKTDMPFISTAMGCGEQHPSSGEITDKFWQKMKTATSWKSDGNAMVITFSDGSIAELLQMKDER